MHIYVYTTELNEGANQGFHLVPATLQAFQDANQVSHEPLSHDAMFPQFFFSCWITHQTKENPLALPRCMMTVSLYPLSLALFGLLTYLGR